MIVGEKQNREQQPKRVDGVEMDITGERGAVDRYRTGVGTPDSNAEAGGMALGGDTGDVGTPRDQLDGNPGETYGTSMNPEGASVVERSEPKRKKGRKQDAA